MTEGGLWREINYGPDGRAHVRVTDPVAGAITVIIAAEEVRTPAGEEIIRRAIAVHRAMLETIRGERS